MMESKMIINRGKKSEKERRREGKERDSICKSKTDT